MKPMRSVIRFLLAGCCVAALWGAGTTTAQPLTRGEARALQQEFQQRCERLEGLVQDLIESQAALSKRLDALATDLRAVERRVAAPAPDMVTQEQLARAVEGLRKAVQKQQTDQGRKITAELERLRKLLAKGGGSRTPPKGPPIPKEGYEYEIKEGDTLGAIVTAYRAAGVKDLTVDLILRANKGLKATRLIPGKKIFIPDPGKK